MLGDGYLRKIAAVLFIFLFLLGNLFVLIPIPARGGIVLWPAELTIDISEYPEEEIQYKIRITNPYNYDIDVVSESVNPSIEDISLDEGYSCIPDLSWLKVSPDVLSIPARSYGYFMLSVEIPESKKPLHYNESWEGLVRFYKKSATQAGSVTVNVKLMSKIFIHTPPGPAKQQAPHNLYLILFLIIGLIILATVVFASRKKRSTNDDRTAIFYYKKKENDDHKKN